MWNWIKKLFRGPANRNSAVPSKAPSELIQVEASALRKELSVRMIRDGNASLDKGNLVLAEECYERAAQIDPESIPALVNLGFVLSERSRHDKARGFLESAIALDSTNSDAHYLLGGVARTLGDINRAIDLLRTALVLKPDFEAALTDLCMLLASSNRIDEALRTLDGHCADPWTSAHHCFLRGNILVMADRAIEAESYYQQANRLSPADSSILMNLGIAQARQKKWMVAAMNCRSAINVDPLSADAHVSLAAVQLGLCALEEAASSCMAAIRLDPDHAGAHVCLGRIRLAEGRKDESMRHLERAAAFDPNSIVVMQALGDIHHAVGDFNAALTYRRRVASSPGSGAPAYLQLGTTLHAIGDLDESIACYRTSIQLNSSIADIHSNLGAAYIEQGDTAEALTALNRAIELDSTCTAARSNRLFLLTSMDNCGVQEYLREAKSYGEAISANVKPLSLANRDWVNDHPVRPVRIGLVSGDFRDHPVGRFLQPLLEHIDRSAIELIAFSTSHQEDRLTETMKQSMSGWHRVFAMEDRLLAQKIVDCQIDILVDLAGHTSNNRLPVFAWRPAPIQISWLGYWASTGVAEMDFILIDSQLPAAEATSQFSEQPFVFSETRMCFSPSSLARAIDIAPLPAIRNGYFTFGSFQSLFKINASVLTLWSEVLRKNPSARLRIQSKHLVCRLTREKFVARMLEAGIELRQVLLCAGVGMREYLEAYSEVDLVLDTFPFTGGTTTCEALWMGVPTLTLRGQSLVSCQGASILSNAGLTGFVALSRVEYVEKANAFAVNIGELIQFRKIARTALPQSRLFDVKELARNFEHSMLKIWRSISAHPDALRPER